MSREQVSGSLPRYPPEIDGPDDEPDELDSDIEELDDPANDAERVPEVVEHNGTDAFEQYPLAPEKFFSKTVHPLQPFAGNAFHWDSWMYDDGTSFEGTTRAETPHGKGVMIMGSGLGGGIQAAEKGDKYEGEFYLGYVHGLGKYTSSINNTIYEGQWVFGREHGCGRKLDLKPMVELIRQGMHPERAWAKAEPEILEKAEEGAWDFGVLRQGTWGDLCPVETIKGVLRDTTEVVTKAKMFRWKPDGVVTHITAQTADGWPAPIMQHPLHYPHNTGFLMPGPAGQCFPLPEDNHVKKAMAVAAHNQEVIWNMYNLPENPEMRCTAANNLKHSLSCVLQPSHPLAKADALWKLWLQEKAEHRMERLQQLQEEERAAIFREEEGDGPGETSGQGPELLEPPQRLGLEEDLHQPEGPQDAGAAEGNDDDDDDLFASLEPSRSGQAATQQQHPVSRNAGGPRFGASVFGSITLNMHRAGTGMHVVCTSMASRLERRRSFARPSRRSW